jgi:uncharacterized Zn finger protein
LSDTSDAPASWSRRFLESLTAIGLGSTWLPRHRTTPPPQLLSFSLSRSVVVALLGAPGDEPYRARIAMRAFSAAEWARIQRELARRTRYAAKLLAGELPRDIETVFDDLDLPLFPRSSRDIAMDCSCPHWEVPCEHLVAVCGRLAETFDADPFDILAWRGRERSELLERLVSARTARASRRPAAGSADRPLARCLDAFWGSELPPPPPAAPPLAESIRKPDLLLDQVPPPTLLVHDQPIVDLLRPLYNTITSVQTEGNP